MSKGSRSRSRRLDRPEHAGEVGPPPRTPDELHAWIAGRLGVILARSGAPGHSAPFDYICHTFFEGGSSWPPAGAMEPSNPADCIVWANRGGGKTFLGALATVLDLAFKPGIQVRILAGSLDQGQRMHEHLRGFFAGEALSGMVAGKITERRIRLVNASSVVVLAASQTSVRGTRVQKLRCDEVDLFDRALWEAAQLTTRSARCGGVRVRGSIECLSTMHRPHGLMFDLVREAASGRRRLFKWGLLDVMEMCESQRCCHSGSEAAPFAKGTRDGEERGAPSCPLLAECGGAAKHLREGGSRLDGAGHISIDDAIGQKSRVPLAVWEAEMLCLRPSRGDSVLPEFDPGRHVVGEEPHPRTILTWVGGMDFGFRSPTVVLRGAIDHASRLWIVEERIVRQETVRQHIAAIKGSRRPPLEWIGIDPAGGQRSDQTGVSNQTLMLRAGLMPRVRRCGVVRGVLAIRSRLEAGPDGRPRLLIHERCAGLIEAMQRYHYDTARPECDQPVKDGPDHAVDALRYLVVNLDLRRGTRVEEY